ncbi:MAG: pyridoxal-phosphate dependent enzyme [Chloroflexi bacterium]|nr:pyridoxal-phosphate dependent enzyme [Chloroflexota bacterium]
MTKIDLTIMNDRLERTLQRVREKNIIIPTLAQQKDPTRVPADIQERLKEIGLWDLHPLNLFRITWKNQPVAHGGGYGGVNYVEFPKSLTGVDARIVGLVGKWFPCGVHKVGAAFGCLVPRLVTGQFDPTTQKAVWPSTGNYCRGGAYDSALLGCKSIAILPEGMSKERFEWLRTVADEVIATPGTESNVKEIFDKCWELRRSGQDLMIFNQFEEFGNYLWHYLLTGNALEQAAQAVMGPKDRMAGFASATGSAGTIAAGDYLKQVFPYSKIIASEAQQCPTLLDNGFGAHRIEGIGDKHVPWVHNVRNTDFITAIDDNAVVNLARLFNEETGKEYLVASGVDEAVVNNLDLLGFSGISNVLSAIKFAKYNELTSNDVVLTVLTDSMELYNSRLQEMHEEFGEYTRDNAVADDARYLKGQAIDYMQELGYRERKRIHNLKYYTWVEQQGRTYDEIMAQWYDPDYWTEIQSQGPEIDALIEDFNHKAAVQL